MIVTATQLGFQKLAGFFYSGLGATYTTTVAAGTGIIRTFNVLKRPISGSAASSVGVGGGSGTVEFTENADVEFELEVWGHVTRVGTFTITSVPVGGRQGSSLASYNMDESGNITGFFNSQTGDEIPLSSGSVANIQVLTATAATSGITVTEGANVVLISPAIAANVNFTINTGAVLGDSLTLIVPQNATGGWDLIVDGVDYCPEPPTALTQIVIKLEHDGTNWNLTNTPTWN
jgi:hypothetical protein